MNIRLLIFLLLLSGIGFGQNIINNPGFESGLSGWRSILSVDEYGGYGSCQEGSVFPASGNGSVGVRIYHETYWEYEQNWQEYILQMVANEMKEDTVYRVSLKYRLADRCTTSTDALGVGFLNFNHSDENVMRQHIQSREADVKNPSGQWITNMSVYKEFSGYYKAKGDEVYIAIGAFKMDHQMTRIPNGQHSNYAMKDILYFFDDVKVVPCLNYPPDPLPDERIFCSQGMVQLSTPPITGAQFLWSTGDTTPQINVFANNQEVWLEITKNGCVRKDTVKLTVFSGAFDLGEDRTICSADEFPLTLSAGSYPNEHVLWNTGSTDAYLAVNEGGIYYAKKFLDDCLAKDTIRITDLSHSAFIYPNPVETTFSIGDAYDIRVLQIRTEDGKAVFNGDESTESLTDFIGALTPAVYFVTATANGCIIGEKMVKIRK